MTAAPVLLLHGIQSGPSTFWRVGVDLETLGAAVAAPAVPGHAGRPLPATPTLGGLADAIAPERPSVVVGHSLGALVALELAARRPDLVRALVLEDPPSRSANDPAAVARSVADDAALARSDPDRLRARLAAENPLWAGTDVEHAVANRAAVDDRAAEPLLVADWDLAAMAAAVRCPVTLIAATAPGTALGGPERDALAAAADRVVVVESGHGVHRDRPGVWVAVVAAAVDRALGSATGRHAA
ncbi:alpha/beta fold hydrolase [Amnibacterium kyonggiense]